MEFSAKTVKSAIEEGLRVLDKTLDEVDIKIISQGGFMRKAKVSIDVIRPVSEQVKPEVKEARREEKPFKQEIKVARQQEKREVREVKLEEKREVKQEKKEAKKDFKEVKKEAKEVRKDKEPKEIKEEKREAKPKFEKREREEREYAEITPEVSERAVEFLTNLVSKMGVECGVESKIENNCLYLKISCESGLIIGYRGETLDAIEYLTSLCINSNRDLYYKFDLDCNGYREKRNQTLASLAERMAKKAITTRRKVVLEPMSNSSRRIIHSVLSENNLIITRSEGDEPRRRIIIIPKK